MKLLILDGNSIANRAFYGIHMLNAPDGTPTNAIYGFLNIMRHHMTAEAPDGICVTFDLPAPTFRHIRYDGYKAQRKGMPDELAVQMPVIKEILAAMNIQIYELAGWEADDLIGTISHIADTQNWESIIVTGDRDTFQLITNTTSVMHVKSRMGKDESKLYNITAFQNEYGFSPKGIIDLKALMGDKSDNIPGVAGIGEKTAMTLIQTYGDIQNIYENLNTLNIRQSLRQKLEDGREMAKLSYELAEIHTDAPIDFTPQSAIIKEFDNDLLYNTLERLGFNKHIREFGLVSPESIETPETVGLTSSCESVIVASEMELQQLRSALDEAEITAVRCEDDLSIVIAEPKDIDTAFVLYNNSAVYEDGMKLVFSANVKKAGHDIKDLQRQLLEHGFKSAGWVYDTAIAAYLLDPTAGGYEIGSLTKKYAGFTLDSTVEEGEQLTIETETTETLARLMSEAAAVLCLMDIFTPKLENAGLMGVFQDIELPLCSVLASMEHTGFLADGTALDEFGKTLSARIAELEESIYTLAGETFNINSPKQLGEILFEKMNLPHAKKTKTGYSTNADVLEKLRSKSPIVGLVLEYRELAKLKSTYTDGLKKMIASDGRIHTRFQMTVTATGRLSSTEPNLQNIPVRRELGGEIRKMFTASDGCVLVDADYSQIELRILAHIANDEAMIGAFLSGEDIHRITAAQVLGISPEDVTPQERRKAKAVNFGIVYGISAFSLSDDIGVSIAEARDYINLYMAHYHGVSEYMERVVKEAKEKGYAVTLYGRRRPMPELSASNRNVRAFGERVARNMPIQGTAADIMKIAMINVYRALEEAKLTAKILLQVHDELIVECPESETETVKEILKREMEGVAKLSVPLTVEVNSGGTWYDAK